MNQDYDETMISSSEDEHVHSEENHICTEGHVCTAPHEEVSVLNIEIEKSDIKSEQSSMIFKIKHLPWIILGVIVIVFIGLTMFVYARPTSDKSVELITRVIPYPAIIVGRSFVTIHEYQTEKEALSKYFSSLPADSGTSLPEGDQLEQMISETLVNKLVIKTIASNLGVRLDPLKVEASYAEILKTQKSEEDFKNQLQTIFGWDVSQFKKNIVESIVLSKQLDETIAESKSYQEPQKKLIDDAYVRLTNGEDFATVAKEVHKNAKIVMDSDLGVMKESALPTEWSKDIKDLQKDQMSPVVDLSGGYAIFKLIDRSKTGDDTEVHLFVVTVPKMNLEQVIKEYLSKVTIKTLIK